MAAAALHFISWVYNTWNKQEKNTVALSKLYLYAENAKYVYCFSQNIEPLFESAQKLTVHSTVALIKASH